MPEDPRVLIRDPEPGDEAAWRHLWSGYVAFYEASVPEAVTAQTWARILDPDSPVFATLARLDGTVLGFTVSVLHPSTWTSAPSCYLEDLFVAPQARGRGVGRALLDDLVSRAKQNGWSRLYWHTKATNETARRLYDRYTQADGFVRYRLSFPA
ncbi:GNAT family acetyltransferase [Methyloceanibacter methanicus]|uniref:GNAT family acetyltransferase n=1 Tax=Methyloceanibacter methanicus TaxID=1774968 RepID=A0A1E3W2H7_9HYPH|nr:GNAT family N-acetyltransferase [Methyloceanibacter methanicus]ODR99980.1 GNAT family acetyltransferase [Methyloceanibacter methanicus]